MNSMRHFLLEKDRTRFSNGLALRVRTVGLYLTFFVVSFIQILFLLFCEVRLRDVPLDGVRD
jgi:hypothetical protein